MWNRRLSTGIIEKTEKELDTDVNGSVAATSNIDKVSRLLSLQLILPLSCCSYCVPCSLITGWVITKTCCISNLV